MKFIGTLLFLYATLAYGQIVNIENKRLDAKKEGFSGSADLNINFTMNNKQLLQVGDKLKLGYTKKKHHALIITDHSFVKSKDDDFINQGYEHLRYNYQFKDSGRVSFEAFQQGQFNKIQRINLRLLLGSGVRLNILDQKNYQLNVGTGFMGEYEELLDGGGTSNDILSTSYFSENIGMNSISYIQPKFIDYGNYRFSNETYIRFNINKYLSFKVIYSITHDSRDIEDVRKTNYTLRNSLSIKF
jgi:putative salt-induced outer membrane protein YdiY